MESPTDTAPNRKNVAFRLLEQKITKKNAASAAGAASKKAAAKQAVPKKAARKQAASKKAPPKKAQKASGSLKRKVNVICFFE